jgi:hypothetical protein
MWSLPLKRIWFQRLTKRRSGSFALFFFSHAVSNACNFISFSWRKNEETCSTPSHENVIVLSWSHAWLVPDSNYGHGDSLKREVLLLLTADMATAERASLGAATMADRTAAGRTLLATRCERGILEVREEPRTMERACQAFQILFFGFGNSSFVQNFARTHRGMQYFSPAQSSSCPGAAECTTSKRRMRRVDAPLTFFQLLQKKTPSHQRR